MAQKKRSSAKTWKTKEGTTAEYAEDLELPSGNVCLVRRIGPDLFLSAGLLPDNLTAEVEKAVKQKQGLPPSKMKKVVADMSTKDLGQMMAFLDKVLCFAVVEPVVQMPPACQECGEYAVDDRHMKPGNEGYHGFRPGKRDPEILYADVVDMEDKMFVLDFVVGGTRDYEKFRKKLGAAMADVSTS